MELGLWTWSTWFTICHLTLQLVSLDQSQFSGALVRIPSRDLTELEPDWEIDPAGLVIMDKLGMTCGCSMQCNPAQAASYCYLHHTVIAVVLDMQRPEG